MTIIKHETCIDPDDLPEIFPSGLSDQRKQYLFEQIRQFCDEKYRDIFLSRAKRKEASTDR